MTTQAAGGKITGILALTMIGSVALEVGDWVHVSGDYTVALADGSKSVIGMVSVKNVKVTQTSMSRTVGVGNPGGDVTVEARGLMVETVVSGAAIAAGADVGVAADGTIQTMGVGAGLMKIGIALVAATAAGQDIDVLITGA